MNDYIEVIAIVEGKTEEVFINSILKPYLADRNIFMQATQVTKPGQKGGDVRFVRVQNDIKIHLKQRSNTYVTTLVDYYGTKEWPGLDQIPLQATPQQISDVINAATLEAVTSLFSEQRAAERFIPYMAMHEFEALLFCDSAVLATELSIDEDDVISVLAECGEPEAINNSRETAPSKRLDAWSPKQKFPKTTTGIAIAKGIGIQTMREKCPQFNQWLNRMESIRSTHL
jgi:hypothetical protein